MVEELHLSSYRRLLWRRHHALVVRGSFAEARFCRDLYEARHGIAAASGTAAVELDRALAALALAGVALVERESWGISVTLPGRDFGLFVGLEAEGMICGRIAPAEREGVLAVVQRQRAGGPLVQSTFEPPGADVVEVFEEYYRRVEQVPTRLGVTDGWEGALIQSLPGGELSFADGLPAGELTDLIDRKIAAGDMEPMHEVLIFYECRCNDDLIRAMISSVSGDARADLFGREPALLIECPRCGRGYSVRCG